MFIRQLYYLTALSKEKHFARAAEVCHVSQPTLSAGIQHLEEELGVAIVKRAQRFEGFTAEGERVLVCAQHIQANWDGLKQDVRGMCGELDTCYFSKSSKSAIRSSRHSFNQ
ncbi:MAG: LysR family transcriptional regulator [Gammaproteobacteria bacterium]